MVDINIEIGAGTLLTPGFIALDPVHGNGPWRRYAQDTPWPTGDNTVDKLRASHVLEHIPAGIDQRVKVMNEAHRVLKPGGTFEIIVPLIQAHGQPVNTWHAWADCTHVSWWVMPESFLYFCEGPFKPNADYGIKEWQFMDDEMEVRHGWEGRAVLRKPA